MSNGEPDRAQRGPARVRNGLRNDSQVSQTSGSASPMSGGWALDGDKPPSRFLGARRNNRTRRPLTHRRPFDVPFRARASPAQPSFLGGGFGRGAKPPSESVSRGSGLPPADAPRPASTREP